MGVIYYVEKPGVEATFNMGKLGWLSFEDVFPRDFTPLPSLDAVVGALGEADAHWIAIWYPRLAKWANGSPIRVVPENDDNVCWRIEGSVYESDYGPDGTYTGNPDFDERA